MRKLLVTAVCAASIGVVSASCNGTTGDAIVIFPAYAKGVAWASQPFKAGNGNYTIQLTSAEMRIGAVYVNESPTEATGFGTPVCYAPNVFAGQVPGGALVNLLSSEPQEFSYMGNGTEDVGESWQMWLTDGDINEANSAHMVDLVGVATNNTSGAKYSFGATVTINQSNRGVPVTDPSQPGLNPICKQRVVQVGQPVDQIFAGGALVLTIDPTQWLIYNIDFSQLPPISDPSCQLDPNTNYDTNQSCTTAADCTAGYVCNSDPLTTCNPKTTTGCTCMVQYCIPDTNNPTNLTGAPATVGRLLFGQIVAGSPNTYSLSYVKSP